MVLQKLWDVRKKPQHISQLGDLKGENSVFATKVAWFVMIVYMYLYIDKFDFCKGLDLNFSGPSYYVYAPCDPTDDLRSK